MTGAAPDVLVSCGAPYDARGGMSASYATIARMLAERGLQVETRFAPQASGRWGSLVRQSEYARVAYALARRGPRVAVVSSADSAAASLLHRRGTKLIAMSNGIEHLARAAADEYGYGQDHFRWGHRHLREPLLRLAFRRADATVVLSRRQRDYVVDEWGLDPDTVHVLPQAVEDDFHDAPGVDRVPGQVLWIGQWAEFKGLDRLPRILEGVVDADVPVSVVLAGVRVEEQVVRAAFPARLQEHLVVRPVVERSEMVDLVATSHVGLVTSYFEGFGKMILEMMAGGLPVVASRVGAAEDFIVPGVSGALYDDERVATDLLVSLLSGPFRDDIGRAARAAVQHCRREPVGDAWAQLVRSVGEL